MLLLHVDAFTDKPFAGNPAAVCVLDRERDAKWMQSLASEMNLSETAFLLQRGDGFNLRWFTPTVEVALCGHATLASAHALWEQGVLPHENEARFHTQSGLLTAKREGGMIWLDFPTTAPQPSPPPDGMLEALGTRAKTVCRAKFDYLVEVESEEELRRITPDHARLRNLGARGVAVTALSSQYDFVSRYFAPGSGIDEDPVTGSSHCMLAPFWAARLGRNDFTAYQASARGGIVHVKLRGERVGLGGHAVTVTRGEIAL
jgi:PhzF family phenazine biosynthesis protein